MGGYIAQFMVYTIAMVGLIFAALLVYKKVSEGCGFSAKSDFLDIEDRISLSPRKNLYVIRAGNEKFLVASDIERTTLISRLDQPTMNVEKTYKETTPNVDELPSIVEFPKNKKLSVIRKMINGVTTNDLDIDIVE